MAQGARKPWASMVQMPCTKLRRHGMIARMELLSETLQALLRKLSASFLSNECNGKTPKSP